MLAEPSGLFSDDAMSGSGNDHRVDLSANCFQYLRRREETGSHARSLLARHGACSLCCTALGGPSRQLDHRLSIGYADADKRSGRHLLRTRASCPAAAALAKGLA